MNLHNQIMNIPISVDRTNWLPLEKNGYAYGHRDARHSAAELSLKAEARIEELEEALKGFVNWERTQHIESLFDDHELWKRAEQLLENKQ